MVQGNLPIVVSGLATLIPSANLIPFAMQLNTVKGSGDHGHLCGELLLCQPQGLLAS